MSATDQILFMTEEFNVRNDEKSRISMCLCNILRLYKKENRIAAKSDGNNQKIKLFVNFVVVLNMNLSLFASKGVQYSIEFQLDL
jgi:ABC-type uncharacterized transport system ATPase subunit